MTLWMLKVKSKTYFSIFRNNDKITRKKKPHLLHKINHFIFGLEAKKSKTMYRFDILSN